MHKQIVDACKFLRCFARCPICGQNSLLITNLSVFTLIWILDLLRKPTQSPWLDSHPLLKKEWCCLCGPGSHLLLLMIPSLSRRNRRKDTQKRWWGIWALLSLYSQGSCSFHSRECGSYRWFLLWADRSETRNKSPSAYLLLPQWCH